MMVRRPPRLSSTIFRCGSRPIIVDQNQAILFALAKHRRVQTNDLAGDVADKVVLDAAVIAAAQAVEHYGITRSSTWIGWA